MEKDKKSSADLSGGKPSKGGREAKEAKNAKNAGKKPKKSKKTKILFVCTGNTCRSPMAEQLFKWFLRQKKQLSLFEVCSAGLFADEGAKMNGNAEKALLALGVKPRPHQSVQLTETAAESADLIVCMTAGHKDMIEGSPCVFSIGELTGASDAPDPYGGDLDRYLTVARYLQYACTDIYNAAQRLKENEI